MIVGGLAVIVLAVIVVSTPAWRHRNRGDDTTCPNFLTMSHSRQVVVIRKGGFSPYTTAEKLTASAVRACTRARHTSDEDDTIGIILGP